MKKFIVLLLPLLTLATTAWSADLNQSPRPDTTCRAYLEQRPKLPAGSSRIGAFLQSADRFCSLPQNEHRSPIEELSSLDEPGFFCPEAFYGCVATGLYYYYCLAFWCYP